MQDGAKHHASSFTNYQERSLRKKHTPSRLQSRKTPLTPNTFDLDIRITSHTLCHHSLATAGLRAPMRAISSWPSATTISGSRARAAWKAKLLAYRSTDFSLLQRPRRCTCHNER